MTTTVTWRGVIVQDKLYRRKPNNHRTPRADQGGAAICEGEGRRAEGGRSKEYIRPFH